ncbi:hypothetical protein BC939DRAFT_158389 [Gamsiella multidivaricata]|uniref:uncharacterized protein n=1 Tax=Gamsiella multidivaricata TaxID=101098 RepID=UPI0022200D5C|nr:uncharacterized protein BC939DRAFT_158389 [Gamsiella multidivaricata]KAI7823510.1 hypothetical protein BC939DRAFT_158389 [Gamsiella multidivaricata]
MMVGRVRCVACSVLVCSGAVMKLQKIGVYLLVPARCARVSIHLAVCPLFFCCTCSVPERPVENDHKQLDITVLTVAIVTAIWRGEGVCRSSCTRSSQLTLKMQMRRIKKQARTCF